jgi:hypothetical protein
MGLQIITTEAGEELVVLPRRQYDALLARLGDEEAEDRMTVVLAREAIDEEPLPAAVSAAILGGASRLRALCDWRSLTAGQLARRAKIEPAAVARFVTGGTRPADADIDALAYALDIPRSWLD